MNYIVKSILLTLSVLISLNTHAVSFTADASHARMFWNDGSVRFEYKDPGVPVKYNPCNGFLNAGCNRLKSTGLNDRRNDKWQIAIKVNGRQVRRVDAELAELDTVTGITFGTANK